MDDIYYLRHNGEQSVSWRISLTEMENIVHTQSRPYNPNSNPGPELPLSYEASVAQPPFLPPSDNFTTLAMNKKGYLFRKWKTLAKKGLKLHTKSVNPVVKCNMCIWFQTFPKNHSMWDLWPGPGVQVRGDTTGREVFHHLLMEIIEREFLL